MSLRWVVGIDPGLPACGASVFDESGTLQRAALVRNKKDGTLPERWQGAALAVQEWLGHGPDNVTLVVEMPKIYPASRQKGDQNDLINLAGVVSALCVLLYSSGTRIIYPRDWKGTLDPDDMIRRVQGRLSQTEHERIEMPSAASLQHNVWDGIGIGLHALGRLEPKRVFPR
jgi:hypothetical protein